MRLRWADVDYDRNDFAVRVRSEMETELAPATHTQAATA